MASGMTNDFEGLVIDHFLRGSTQTATSGWFALFSTAPTETGTGTELGLTLGYGRIAVGFGADTDGTSSNAGAVTFTSTGDTWAGIVGHAIYTAETSGTMLMFEDTISGPTLTDTDKYEFGIGDIEVVFT